MSNYKYRPDVKYTEIPSEKLQSISNEILNRLCKALYGITTYHFGQDKDDPTSVLIEVVHDGIGTAFGVKASFAISVSERDIANQVVRAIVGNLEITRQNLDEKKP
jgi:hypothetical protein